MRQLDIYFTKVLLHSVSAEYFKNLGVKYAELTDLNNIRQIFKDFNFALGDVGYKRCCILVDVRDNMCEDNAFIFEPLRNNRVPRSICDYTEIPFIANTKTNPLPSYFAALLVRGYARVLPEELIDLCSDFYAPSYPELTMQSEAAICLSLHRHGDGRKINTERMYVSCGKFGCRAFKRTLVDVLAPFCTEESRVVPNGWQQDVSARELHDELFASFCSQYFGDLNLGF